MSSEGHPAADALGEGAGESRPPQVPGALALGAAVVPAETSVPGSFSYRAGMRAPSCNITLNEEKYILASMGTRSSLNRMPLKYSI